jgi:CubicO group peptidase (beta-lactamase class C family)
MLLGQLADGFPPAVAIRVCTSEGFAYAAAGGWARLADAGFPEPVPADAETLFDLASLTKVVATLPLVLLLHQRGRWSIDDAIARWLPGAPRSPVTISQCLLHVAGLVPHRPYYATCADPAEIRRAVTAELADAVPGQVSYSDLGFMLLGWAVEECADEPLEELAVREVLGPLGMTSTGYRPRVPLRRIAATEADGDQRTGSGVVWGSVHDGNAFALGEVSGHAGLFGTAADLGRFASALLAPDRHPVLSAKTLELMTARQAGAGAEARGLGWRLRPEAWGDWPDGTIWHTGFTGTSLLIAPALDVAVVLLSNAVHPVRRLDQTGAFRAGVHRAVRDAVGLPGDGRRSAGTEAGGGPVAGNRLMYLGRIVSHLPVIPAWGSCATSPVYLAWREPSGRDASALPVMPQPGIETFRAPIMIMGRFGQIRPTLTHDHETARHGTVTAASSPR